MTKKKTEFDKVIDSGQRQKFKTGAVRDTQKGKGRYDLISPIAMQRLAKHYENGAKKYGEHNWQKGMPLSRYIDSVIRHAYKLLMGMEDEDHAAAIAWNAFAYIHTKEMIDQGKLPKELNNITYKKEKQQKTMKLNEQFCYCKKCKTKLQEYFAHPDNKIFKRCPNCLTIYKLDLNSEKKET